MPVGWLLQGIPVVLVATKVTSLVFGGVLTYVAYKAFRRTRSKALRSLSAGIGLLTAGAILSGVLYQLLDVPLAVSASVQSAFTAAGFGLMIYSLFAGVESGAGAPS